MCISAGHPLTSDGGVTVDQGVDLPSKLDVDEEGEKGKHDCEH